MNSTTKNLIKILIVLLVSGSTFLLPFEAWGVPINPIQARVVALFVMAALMWILEPIPIWTTSVLVITIALLCLSSGSFSFARPTVYDVKAVEKIVKTAAAPGLEPAVMEDVMAAVKKRLSKKSNLDANEIYTSVDYVLLNHSDKAKKAAVKASRELGEAVMNEAGAALPAPVAEALRLRLAAKPILSKTEVDTSIAYVVDEVAKAAPEQQATLQAAAMGLQSKVNAMDTAALDKEADKYAKLEATCNAFETDATREQLKKMPIVNVIQAKNAMATFADPIIILFLGGFFLAAAATKYRLDINLARWLIKPFGTKPANVLLGLMVVTALFSMFMSNTATAAMMLAILAPVLSLFAPEDRGRAAFALCIPVAANIGGIGTPIGTPPNAIALKAMADMGLSVDFGKWMVFGVPFVIVMLLIAWALLRVMFPIQQKELKLEMGGKFLKTPKAIVVYVTFVVSVLLWVFGGSVGLDSNTVAIIPIAVFSATQVITKDDLKKMSWDVLWLVAGGFALGLALQETNLAKDMINAIPFASWDPMLLMVGVGFICLFMATFMSHTATASLLMPIMGAVAGSMISAGAMDSPGAIGLLVAVAFCSSLGMALPISTPPNALAYATGLVESKGMAISGTILCLIGVVLTFLLMHFLAAVHFFG